MPSESILLSPVGRTESNDLAAARAQLHAAIGEDKSTIIEKRRDRIGLAAGLVSITLGSVLGGPVGFFTSVLIAAGLYVVYQKLNTDAKPKPDFSLQEQKMLRDYNSNIIGQLSDHPSSKKADAIVDESIHGVIT